MRRTLVAVVIALAPAVARADQLDACVEGADRAQQLRDQGKLIEAREQLLVCGGESCPGAVAKQCARWLQEVETEMPTVSLRVRSATGADVVDVAVLVDDAPRLPALDGRPLVMNPGPHRLTFRREDAVVEESLVVRAGEKNRLVDVQFPGKVVEVVRPPPPPVVVVHRSFRFPWPSAVFLGFGVAGGVTTAALVVMASHDAADLRRQCAPGCTSSQVDAVRNEITGANVALGVGIAGVALSAMFLVIANTGHRNERRIVSFTAAPTDHGLMAAAFAVF